MAYYNLGLAQRLRGYLDEAITPIVRPLPSLLIMPRRHQNLGVALFKLGKLPEAIQSFGHAAQNLWKKPAPARAGES